MYLQINMVKYNADWEITNIYENLQIVQSQFFTDMLLFIYIQSTLNIYWFIGILIHCQQYQQIAIWLLLTIHTIRSAIWWAITKVILNYLRQPNYHYYKKRFVSRINPSLLLKINLYNTQTLQLIIFIKWNYIQKTIKGAA